MGVSRRAGIGIAKSDSEPYHIPVMRRFLIHLLSAAFLSLALGGVSPAVYCAASMEVCPGDHSDPCSAAEDPGCCSRGEGKKSLPGCCFAVAEKGEGWVLPVSLKIPDMILFEHYTLASLAPGLRVLPAARATSSNPPDPPGPWGRALLRMVNRQLV